MQVIFLFFVFVYFQKYTGRAHVGAPLRAERVAPYPQSLRFTGGYSYSDLRSAGCLKYHLSLLR